MNEVKNVFITGASGCVGHYLVDEFLADDRYRLILLVRNRDKLRRDIWENPKVTLVEAALEDFEKYAPFLKEVDYLIHAATSWGGSDEINRVIPFKIFQTAAAARCQKTIHFSTASILDENNLIFEGARQFGSEYIKSKLKLCEEIRKWPGRDRVITVFPTLVLGGDKTHPYSYISQALPEIKKWFWLLRFFSVDAGFHLIHAKDIAQMVKTLVENENEKKEFVFGYPYTTARDFIKKIAGVFNKKVYFQINLPAGPLVWLAKKFGATFLPWDIYCIRHHRHFRYQSTVPEDFSLKSRFSPGDYLAG